MLLSDKKKFIFIHIYKNAGKSITASLLSDPLTKMKYVLNRVSIKARFPLHIHPQPFSDHVSAENIINEMGVDKYNEYFSFAFVRNPWSWQVSLYNYALKNRRHHQHQLVNSFTSFDHYLDWRIKNEVRLQKDFIYSEDGRLLVNFVGRYENLKSDFEYICEKIDVQSNLQKINVWSSTPYQDLYESAESIEKVRDAYREDIELFGYEFDN